MHEFAVKVLLTLSAFVGTTGHPPVTEAWEILSDWEKTEEGYVLFVAESNDIVCECRENPSFYLEFPTTIHSSSQVLLGDQLIAETSSPDFKYTKGFYGSLVVPCYQITNSDQPLTWRVLSYTEYFAWFKFFPKVVENYPKTNFFSETLHIGAAVILLILCLLYIILFSGKISKWELLSLVLTNFFTAIYFIGTVAGFIGLRIPMLTAHRVADTGLWIGFLFFIHFLYLERLVLSWMNTVYKVAVFIALTIIIIGSTGDTIQLGTTVPFGFTMVFIFYAVWKLINKNLLIGRKYLLQFIGLSCFLIAYFNDLFVVIGITSSVPILPLGVIGSYVFILLSVNERITETYTERDELKTLSEQLKQSNHNLVKTQDKLVKSEKMAAMGRAVARIAHELNTPICAARSSVQNISTQTKKFLGKFETENSEDLKASVVQYKEDMNTMEKVLVGSVSRAAELVRSFKEISTDQTQVRKKEFELRAYIKTCLESMSNLLKRQNIIVNIEGDELVMYSDPGLFYQIIENLISNAQKYAYDEKGGRIDICIKDTQDEIILVFSDYGKGIPEEDRSKIFDAFFTTGGGKGGTGLGLNIVSRIVENQLKGAISCDSKEGKGTIFTIVISR